MIKKQFRIMMIAIGLTLCMSYTNALAVTPELLNQISAQETQLQVTDENIEKLMTKISDSTVQFNKIEQKIKSNNEVKIKTLKELDEAQKLSDGRTRALYMNSMPIAFAYLEVLLSSENFSDLTERYDNIQQIMKFDNELILTIQKDELKLELITKDLVTSEINLKRLKSDLAADLTTLKDKKEEQSKLLKELNIKMTAELKQEQDARTKAFEQSILEVQTPSYLSRGASQTSNFLSIGTGADLSSSIMRAGAQFIGLPYVWGGTTPSGFDCSGFTQYIYSYYGINLPRVAEDQQNIGVNVGMDEAKPGDLVFFGRPAHHVGIYAGNGLMLHSPHTGDVIKISKIDISTMTNIQRVLNFPDSQSNRNSDKEEK